MSFIESTNIFLKNLNDNKVIMILIVVLLSLYASIFVNSVGNFLQNLLSNDIFKFIIFCLIAYISYSNPTIGIILAISVLVTFQTILYLNLQNQIKSEKFSNMVSGFSQDNQVYLDNPLQLQSSLDPSLVNFNLNLENPNQIYQNMVKNGKLLLDDSLEMLNDLDKLPDSREQRIYNTTKRDGETLVQSGLNRLEVCDQGEYNIYGNNYNNENIKFVKFNKLIGDYINDPIIISTFNQLQNNFDKLQTGIVNKESFDYQLEIIYKNEIDLLKQIFKLKKPNLDERKINKIESIFKQLNKINYNKIENFTTDENHSKNSKEKKVKFNTDFDKKVIILHIAELVELLS